MPSKCEIFQYRKNCIWLENSKNITLNEQYQFREQQWKEAKRQRATNIAIAELGMKTCYVGSNKCICNKCI